VLYQDPEAQGDPAADTRSDTPEQRPLEGAPPAGAPSSGAAPTIPPEAPTPDDATADARRLLAGKYATKDGLLRAVTEAASKYADRDEALEAFYGGVVQELGRQGADVAQMRRDMDEAQQQPPQVTADEELADMMALDPVGFVRTFRQLMGQHLAPEVQRVAETASVQVRAREQSQQAAQDEFFAGNPDLAGEAESQIVHLVAETLKKDPHINLGGLSSAEIGTLLADTSRKIIQSLRTSTPSAQPPPVSPASRVRTGPAAPQPQRSIQERALDEWGKDVDERTTILERRLRLARPKPIT